MRAVPRGRKGRVGLEGAAHLAQPRLRTHQAQVDAVVRAVLDSVHLAALAEVVKAAVLESRVHRTRAPADQRRPHVAHA